MNITVNGNNIEFEGETVADLLVKLGFINGGCAVAIDNKIILRDNHSTHYLCEGSSITIIVATHGG